MQIKGAESVKELTQELKQQARRLGFVLSGVTASAAPGRLEQFHTWLDAGYAGQMHYLAERREAYGDPRRVLDGCRSILMLGLPYAPLARADRTESPPQAGGTGRVARYAAGELDYHDVIHQRLKALKAWLLQRCPQALARGVVDTAPLLEREFAEAAGLGWVGKNTLLLNREWGSYFFLAALLTDVELAVDPPYSQGFCGTCTACLTACPTRAFPQPFVLDATRCISYLTIEHRDAVPESLRGELGDWVFGCDICQEVCPWNRKAAGTSEPQLQPLEEMLTLDLLSILEMTDDDFRLRFRRTPLWRARRRGMLRNAILCVGNQRLVAAQPALCRLLNDDESLLRGAAAWGLRQLRLPGWRAQLEAALLAETDADVRAAIESALVADGAA